MRPTLLIFVLTIVALNSAREACADETIVLRSVDGASTIELSCTAGKKLALLVKTRLQPPVFRPSDPAVGIASSGAVQYTFDGEALSREEWLRHEDGVGPRDEAQLRAFVRRLFIGQILHLGVGGMQASEFRLDAEAPHLREFAQSCIRS